MFSKSENRRFRSAAVPGRSNVQREESAREYSAAWFAKVAAPEDGRTPYFEIHAIGTGFGIYEKKNARRALKEIGVSAKAEYCSGSNPRPGTKISKAGIWMRAVRRATQP
ncbi:MAG: hypothetical protein P4N60_17015 [Verrucomicrobiae bacterium]|nr:hypothetical protein [Verrucomicrobiae bacterium]